VIGVLALTVVVASISSEALDEDAPVPSPFRVASVESITRALLPVCLALFLGLSLACWSSLAFRWRTADRVRRRQLSWLLLPVAVFVAGALVGMVMLDAFDAPVWLSGGVDWVTVLALLAIPVSTGVAILRYDLFDIELVLNRTLVYVSLSFILVGGYVLIVQLLVGVLPSDADATARLVATAAVAVAFAPLRHRLQLLVDRMLFGERRDPYAVVARVSRRLDLGDTGDSLLDGVVSAVAQALRLPYVAIESSPTGAGPTSAWGRPIQDMLRFPLRHGSTELGNLVVAARHGTTRLSNAERSLLEDLARLAGLVVYSVGLADQLAESRTRLVTAQEEERRRLRRDLHDGLAPALAGMTLQLDAAIGLLDSDVCDAARRLDRLREQLADTVSGVRRVVDGLRPPALDQLGLADAVRQQAATYAEGERHLETQVFIDAGDPLPAAVEVAAYWIACEAVRNASRHAEARHCSVGFVRNGDELKVEVIDDGTGIPSDRGAGVGLSAMRERATELGGVLEIHSSSRGTSITARLPLGEPDV
jgi:signal transduction histidine kinase